MMGVGKKSSNSDKGKGREGWKEVARGFKNPRKLHEKMLKLAMLEKDTPESKKQWEDSIATTRGLDANYVSEHSPAPIVVIIRYMWIMRMLRTCCEAIRYESQPAPPNPTADQVFDTIDRDNSGTVDAKELVGYLLRQARARPGSADGS